MWHDTLPQCIFAAWTMMLAMLAVPGRKKSAEIEWRGLVLGPRMLRKSSPASCVNRDLLASWLGQFRLGIEQEGASGPSWRDEDGQPRPVLLNLGTLPTPAVRVVER
jgi:hypothetical protein